MLSPHIETHVGCSFPSVVGFAAAPQASTYTPKPLYPLVPSTHCVDKDQSLTLTTDAMVVTNAAVIDNVLPTLLDDHQQWYLLAAMIHHSLQALWYNLSYTLSKSLLLNSRSCADSSANARPSQVWTIASSIDLPLIKPFSSSQSHDFK
ncbi:hypothetical protein KP509_31G004200 [Ceratopteris richardii]|uniref:Uncharacterized protein n=1 Tax=Ceratopteris richardii TaxID=49495 RepID=A0A8T2QWF1_CERRI|nr:hypothetical protein KP509_31G004200 [Ceratopteris richardii]